MRTTSLALCLFVHLASTAIAQQVTFVPHDINPASEYPACAVIDVNKDGKLDIVSGGFWYEAPTWKKHFLREVEVIRGRFDDYSNLEMRRQRRRLDRHHQRQLPQPVDVLDRASRREDQDQSRDAVDQAPDRQSRPDGNRPAVRHRRRRQARHPAQRHRRSPPGTSCCRKRRADGKVAAASSSSTTCRIEIAGHGVGFGDINGDGRGDIVGPHGWLEAPEDRRAGRWQWHPDWELTRDASIPILVHDVDGDGDNDLIWGRGHRYGLYWLEQRASPKRERAERIAYLDLARHRHELGPAAQHLPGRSQRRQEARARRRQALHGPRRQRPRRVRPALRLFLQLRSQSEDLDRATKSITATAPPLASIPKPPTSTATATSIWSPPIAAAWCCLKTSQDLRLAILTDGGSSIALNRR